MAASTVKAALGLAAAKGATSGVVSASVASLIQGACGTMPLLYVKTAALGLLALGGIAGGAAAVARLDGRDQPGVTSAAAPAAALSREDEIKNEVSAVDREIGELEARLRERQAKRQRLLGAPRGRPEVSPTCLAYRNALHAHSRVQGGCRTGQGATAPVAGAPDAPVGGMERMMMNSMKNMTMTKKGVETRSVMRGQPGGMMGGRAGMMGGPGGGMGAMMMGGQPGQNQVVARATWSPWSRPRGTASASTPRGAR